MRPRSGRRRRGDLGITLALVAVALVVVVAVLDRALSTPGEPQDAASRRARFEAARVAAFHKGARIRFGNAVIRMREAVARGATVGPRDMIWGATAAAVVSPGPLAGEGERALELVRAGPDAFARSPDWIDLGVEDPQRAFTQGLVYRFGIGIDPDPVQARARYAQAAARVGGYGLERLAYARMCLAGEGGEVDVAAAEPHVLAEWVGEGEQPILDSIRLESRSEGWDYMALRAQLAAAQFAQVAAGFDDPALRRRGEEARVELERWARRGAGAAALRLGEVFEQGLGTPVDQATARKWLMRAVAGGQARARTLMAIADLEGRGESPDRDRALARLVKAGRAGDVEAQFLLGRLYMGEWGFERNPAEARWWLEKAREGGAEGVPELLERLRAAGQ